MFDHLDLTCWRLDVRFQLHAVFFRQECAKRRDAHHRTHGNFPGKQHSGIDPDRKRTNLATCQQSHAPTAIEPL
jgi:hypothetical protein